MATGIVNRLKQTNVFRCRVIEGRVETLRKRHREDEGGLKKVLVTIDGFYSRTHKTFITEVPPD